MILKKLYKKLVYRIFKTYLNLKLVAYEMTFKEKDKCLLLAPHADDESIGMGGTLARYGKNFDIICLTDGRKGFPKKLKIPTDIKIQTRKEEFANAMSNVEVNSAEIGTIPDKDIILNYEKFAEIDFQNYDYIFIPNILDQHIDHKTISIHLARYFKENKPAKKIKIGMYEVWSSLPLPNHYVDISDYVETKRKMINAHVSQNDLKQFDNRILGLNFYRGIVHDANYVEAFMIFDIDEFLEYSNLF